MIIHPVFALIKGEDVVNTIICDDGYTMANWIAQAAFGDDAIAVDVSQYAVGIGDVYRDGRFYKKNENGEIEKDPIDVTPTAEESVPIIDEKIAIIEEYTLGMDYKLAYNELGI